MYFGYVSEINEEELERRKDEGYKSGYIIGKFGLERIYDKEVRGINGGDQVEVDVSGRPVQILGRQSPIPGNDLILTIDKHIQETAERAVDEQLALVHAYAAAAVVMNRRPVRCSPWSAVRRSTRISLRGNLNTKLECAEQ